jgi:hypothetical protein
VVDFGAGAGKRGSICREVPSPDIHLTAVEGCEFGQSGKRFLERLGYGVFPRAGSRD